MDNTRQLERYQDSSQISQCVDCTPLVPATLGLPRTGVSVLSPSTLLRLPAALYGAGPALSAVPVFEASTTAWIPLRLRVVSSPPERFRQPEACARSPGHAPARLFPPQRAARAARGLAPSPRARRAFSLLSPSARRRSGLRKSLDRNQVPFARWEAVASLGLSLPLSPPPASYLQRGWGGSSLEFLSPFVLRTARSVFRPVNFSLLSQFKKLPPTALRAFRPVPTLRNAAGSSPFRPLLLVAGAGVWGTFLLGVAFRHIICGLYLIFPPSWVALGDLKTSPGPASTRVSW